MRFRRPQLTNVLQLDGLPGGTLIELVLSGNLLDGTPFTANDCIMLVPIAANASAGSNVPGGAFIEATPPDLFGFDGGMTSFYRWYEPGTEVTFTAPPSAADGGGAQFVRWIVQGAPQPVGQNSVTVLIEFWDQHTQVIALYRRAPRE